MKKFLILLMLVGLLMPGAVWAAKAVFWIVLPDCGCFLFPGSAQDDINGKAQTPTPETARCDLYLTIRVSGFQAPIGVKVIEKLDGNDWTPVGTTRNQVSTGVTALFSSFRLRIPMRVFTGGRSDKCGVNSTRNRGKPI